ncbi:single-stranded DNA-binding protein [Arthrobacter sp. 1P04PC]|uniref:single-stranded DNA-binding protein n=1 Tax=unclassified Arthrobacter TaxID=235627 RepID=UPI0039A32B46
MNDSITIRGFVATEIKSSTTPGGVATASFRLGSTGRRFDRAANAWVDGTTNWFTVQGYRQLAGNMACSIRKGQPVIVTGRLKIRTWESESRIHHAVDIDADAIGHDLSWGAANFTRNTGGQQQQPDGADQGGAPGTAGQGSGSSGGVDAAEDLPDFDEETGEVKEDAA